MLLDFSVMALAMVAAVMFIFYRLPLWVQTLILKLSVISELAITYGLWRMHNHGVTGTLSAGLAGLALGGIFEALRVIRGVKSIW